MGAYQFSENVKATPVEALQRLSQVRRNIPSAVLSTPMAYRAIFSQLTLDDNTPESILYSNCLRFVNGRRDASQRALALFVMLRRQMGKLIAKGMSHQSALNATLLTLGAE